MDKVLKDKEGKEGGVKVGLLSQSAIRGKYLSLKIKPGEPFWKGFARAVFNSENHTFSLRYLNGYVGHLRMNAEHQLEVYFFEYGTPNDEECECLIKEEVSEKLVLFGGKHLLQEVPDSGLVPLCDPQNGTGFRAESRLWNTAVREICEF